VKSLRAVLTKAKNTYRCGNGQVTLVGYSQGAQVVGDTLASSLPASHRAMIGSVIMLADPKRVPKQWHNRMTPKPDNQGVRGSRKVPTAFKGRVSNFCTSDDPICSRNVSTFGTHTTYYRNSKNAWKFAAYHVCHLRTKSRCDWASS
jgi:predicted esterase